MDNRLRVRKCEESRVAAVARVEPSTGPLDDAHSGTYLRKSGRHEYFSANNCSYQGVNKLSDIITRCGAGLRPTDYLDEMATRTPIDCGKHCVDLRIIRTSHHSPIENIFVAKSWRRDETRRDETPEQRGSTRICATRRSHRRRGRFQLSAYPRFHELQLEDDLATHTEKPKN